MRPLQAGKRFGELGADLYDLHHRGDQKSHEQRVSEEAADGQRAGENLPRSEKHDERSDHAEQHARGKAHDRGCGKTLNYVVQQPQHARGKHLLLARFGVVALHHANPAERFRQAPGELGTDFASFAKDWANGLKRLLQREPKDAKKTEGQQRHDRADAEKNDQRNARGEQSANQIDQPGADQVAHSFDVAHDARDQDATFGRVMKRHR